MRPYFPAPTCEPRRIPRFGSEGPVNQGCGLSEPWRISLFRRLCGGPFDRPRGSLKIRSPVAYEDLLNVS